jgi:SAM-dependent methyltransferase
MEPLMREEKRFTRILPPSFERAFVELGQRNADLTYGREVIITMVGDYLNVMNSEIITILDIGAGSGTDLQNIRERIVNRKLTLFAIDSYQPNIDKLKEISVDGFCINIEKEQFPFEDKLFDIVIANQVVEHTKEIFFMFSEVSRVLKPNGIAIIGIPNLAAFHNRILLLVGEQPTCIRMPGPHVRGMTKSGFIQFITTDGYFEIGRIIGSYFYPFPPRLAQKLAKIFPSLATSLYFSCRRTTKPGRFINVLDSRFYETDYIKGEN